MTSPLFGLRIRGVKAHHDFVRDSAGTGRAIVVSKTVLAESEGLGSAQLGALSEPTHLALAGVGMLLGAHLDVVLREAAATMVGEERAVPSFQDVDLGVCELGIAVLVDRAIVSTDEFGPMRMSHQSRERCTLDARGCLT